MLDPICPDPNLGQLCVYTNRAGALSAHKWPFLREGVSADNVVRLVQSVRVIYHGQNGDRFVWLGEDGALYVVFKDNSVGRLTELHTVTFAP